MSVYGTTWAWKYSKASGTEFTVLLAIADASNEEGDHSYKSVASLARMARVSERTVWRAIKSLIAIGEIEKVGEHPKLKTSIYRLPGVLLDGPIESYEDPDKMSPLTENDSDPDTQGSETLTHRVATPDTDGRQSQFNLKDNPKEINVQDPSKAGEPQTSSTSKGLPVSGKRLIYPETGQPATDEQRMEVFTALVEKLASCIEENTGRRPKIQKSWITDARLLLESDGVDPREAWKVLVWSQRDSFWMSKILSMPKFRQKYNALFLEMKNKGKPRRKTNAEKGYELIAELEAKEAQQSAAQQFWLEGGVDEVLAIEGEAF